MFASKNEISPQTHRNRPLSRPVRAALAVATLALFAVAAQSWHASARHGVQGMPSSAAIDGARPAPGPAEVSTSVEAKSWISTLLDAYGDSLAAP
jgi:hypothetical protein